MTNVKNRAVRDVVSKADEDDDDDGSGAAVAAAAAAPSSRERDSPRRDERFVAGDWHLKGQARTMQLPWP